MAKEPKSKAEKKPTIFAVIQALSSQRPLTLTDLAEIGVPYEAFMVNRAFSLSEDTVLIANHMNLRPEIPKEMQSLFYIHAVRPRKRFEKWPKQVSEEEVELVAQYYGMSCREAKLSLHLHTSEDLAAMRDVLATGASPSRIS